MSGPRSSPPPVLEVERRLSRSAGGDKDAVAIGAQSHFRGYTGWVAADPGRDGMARGSTSARSDGRSAGPAARDYCAAGIDQWPAELPELPGIVAEGMPRCRGGPPHCSGPLRRFVGQRARGGRRAFAANARDADQDRAVSRPRGTRRGWVRTRRGCFTMLLAEPGSRGLQVRGRAGRRVTA